MLELKRERLRLQGLQKVIKRTKSIAIEKLSSLLGFPDEDAFLNWLYQLPEEYAITVDREYIVFSTTSHEKIDETLENLQKQFDTWDKTGKI